MGRREIGNLEVRVKLIRRSALEIIVDLARSLNAEDRLTATCAFTDLARVGVTLVPPKAAKRLSRDDDPSVAHAAQKLLSELGKIGEEDEPHRYGKFGL